MPFCVKFFLFLSDESRCFYDRIQGMCRNAKCIIRNKRALAINSQIHIQLIIERLSSQSN
ncbi:MAG: hypothetical protein K0R59_3537 [Sphingobacterium sp.]|jgi:hypothetical protein|nr:hypothetical protein [Sphingobacterium sp.]